MREQSNFKAWLLKAWLQSLHMCGVRPLSNETGSCLYQHLYDDARKDISSVTFFCDDYSCQNKRRIIHIMLPVETINVKELKLDKLIFSEKSQNSNDSVPEYIEKA